MTMRAALLSEPDEDLAGAAFDAAVEAAISAVIGDSFFAKPKQVIRLLNTSPATYYRAVNAGLIETVPHGDGHAVNRPVLGRLMKSGLPSMTAKSAALTPTTAAE
jgi:hypothetical protein